MRLSPGGQTARARPFIIPYLKEVSRPLPTRRVSEISEQYSGGSNVKRQALMSITEVPLGLVELDEAGTIIYYRREGCTVAPSKQEIVGGSEEHTCELHS